MSIPTLLEKIKSYIESEKGKDLLIVVTILCVAISSFFLGKLSHIENKQDNPIVVKFDPSITDYFYKSANEGQGTTPTLSSSKTHSSDILTTSTEIDTENTITEESANEKLSTPNLVANEKGDIVASSRGSKYYYVYCSGAKTLSESNKIYFSSEEEAEANGYTLSTSCTKK